MPSRRQSAFTLLELLVVISIILVLAALLAGGLAGAKAAAQKTSCVNNLKQWGLATSIYLEDNNDNLPREALFDGINTWEATAVPMASSAWYNSLARQIGVTPMAEYAQTPSSQQQFYRPNLFHCPAARFGPVSATYPNFSLAINSKLMLDFEAAPALEAAFRDLKFTQIKVPEKTALFLDGGVPGEPRLSEFQAPFTGQPKAFATQFPGRHAQGGNILFAAGHVLTLRGADVVQMDPASPHRGGAIYPPDKVVWRHDPELIP